MRQFDLKPYLLVDYDHANFPGGARVLDLGCGVGDQLQHLAVKGCRPVGVEVSWLMLKKIEAKKISVVAAKGEQLPFRTNSFDGALCKVVLPYTDERQVVAEMSGVLRTGAECELSVHGLGYYLLYLLFSPALKGRIYGLRSILNTWYYCLTHRPLPGFLGDTIYQSMPRLRRYFEHSGLEIISFSPSPCFWGLPVFIYLRVRKKANLSALPAR